MKKEKDAASSTSGPRQNENACTSEQKGRDMAYKQLQKIRDARESLSRAGINSQQISAKPR